jgi:hypothetical protein
MIVDGVIKAILSRDAKRKTAKTLIFLNDSRGRFPPT